MLTAAAALTSGEMVSAGLGSGATEGAWLFELCGTFGSDTASVTLTACAHVDANAAAGCTAVSTAVTFGGGSTVCGTGFES